MDRAHVSLILVILLTGTRSDATENEDRLKKIVADWNKRRDCVWAVRYSISEKTAYPAGSTLDPLTIDLHWSSDE
jgi:hypothetical protein